MNVTRPTGHLLIPGRRPKLTPTTEREYHENTRLGALRHIPDAARKHLVAFLGEFVGTFLFLFFAFAGTQVANSIAKGEVVDGDGGSPAAGEPIGKLLFIALAFGFSLAVNAWVFFRITGGVFNPAVTLGLLLLGALTPLRAALITLAQILGSIAASAAIGGLLPGPLPVFTTLSPGTSIARGLFLEMFLTFELVFTIFMLAVEKNKATFLAPLGIGLALFIAEMAGVNYTGGSLNPARSFGPAAVYGEFDGWHWIYWVGPGLGSLLAVGWLRVVKGLEYETVNVGQDFDAREGETFREDGVGTGTLPPPGTGGMRKGQGRGEEQAKRKGMMSVGSEA